MASKKRKKPKRLKPKVERGRSVAEVSGKGKRLLVSFLSPDHPGGDDLTYRALWLGEGEEDLTEAVITELVKDGWPETEVRQMAARGARYNRLRNSLVLPPNVLP